MLNVAVIYGGKSKEREVSLKSGRGISDALKRKGCNVIEIDYTSKDFISLLTGIDVVYIALHGKYGEDGRIQGLLDMLEIPYVGSGVLASALAMNKEKSKRIFEYHGIRVAKDEIVNQENDLSSITSNIDTTFSFPLVVKPNQEGSTIGLSIVNNKEELEQAIKSALSFDNEVLIEEFIDGIEVTVAILDADNKIEALPIIEIVPNKNKYYDYESKYTPGGSDHIIPARIDSNTEKLVKQWAIDAHKLLGCETFSRVDFIIPSDGTAPVILEVNTLPGMTETSLYPDAARSVGLSYEDIVYIFVKEALKKHRI